MHGHVLMSAFCLLTGKMTKVLCFFLSYGRLCDMVDHVFPVFMQGEEADFPHSDDFDQCNYWNKVLPEGTIGGEENPQPAKMS